MQYITKVSLKIQFLKIEDFEDFYLYSAPDNDGAFKNQNNSFLASYFGKK